MSGDKTPAREKPIEADLDGRVFQEEWEYASIVGMLMFLVNTRADIQLWSINVLGSPTLPNTVTCLRSRESSGI